MRRNVQISAPDDKTASKINKTSKYTQVCDNNIAELMRDNEKPPYSLYQNVDMITSPVSDRVASTTPITNNRHHLQRALSDPHCPDFINSSEELLLKSVYDNMYNKNDNPDITDVGFEMKRYDTERRSTRILNEAYNTGQEIELVCNCDLKDLYFPRPKSRQRYSSDQNIVHSSSRYNSIHKLDDIATRKEMQPHQQYSLDRKLMRANKPLFGDSPKSRQHTYTCEQNARILQKIERKATSFRKNKHRCIGQKQYQNEQFFVPDNHKTPFGTCARAREYSVMESSRENIITGNMDECFNRRGDGFSCSGSQYNSFRRSGKQQLEERVVDGAPSSDYVRGSGASGKVERFSGSSSGGGLSASVSTGVARSSTGSSLRRGNLTSDSELDDDTELIFDVPGGHLAECQCAFDHVGFNPGYHHLQEEHCFPPAPDVTRRLQGGNVEFGSGVVGGNVVGSMSKGVGPGVGRGISGVSASSGSGGGTTGKQEVTFYRSSSTPATCSNSSSSASGSSRIDLSTRHWWIIVTVLLLAAAAGVGVPIALRISAGASFEERMEFASRLLQEVPLIDGHNDLPWNIRKFLHNKLKDFRFSEDLRNVSPWSNSAWSHTDLPRLKAGHVAAQFWAAYVPCESQHRDAVQLTLEQIDVIRRFTDQYHPQLTLCTSVEEIRIAHQRHQLCSLIGVEGGHSLANSLAVLRTLYQVGVRYLTLTSTCNTPWADCSLVDIPGRKAEHGGLTSFGKSVVKEMNRLGMIVDLSHVSVRTMRDALAVSKAPVIFSHSSAHALCNSTRNVPDATLRKLALNRGIVMVNFYSQFLTCKDVATVADAVAHINHIRDVAGVDNVGLGAGYDGINYVPKGLEDVSSYPALFAELIGSGGWSTDDLKKLAGLNFLRVMSDVERVRDEFRQAKVPPYEEYSPRVKNNNCSSSDLF